MAASGSVGPPLPQAVSAVVSLQPLRATVSGGHSRPLAWRQQQLQQLLQMVCSQQPSLEQALAADLGKPTVEARMEIVLVQQELRHTLRHLRRWLRPRPLPVPLWALPARAAVQCDPLGCVLILGAWNYPLQLCLQPLVSALAAGNTAVLKPSEQAPHTAALLAQLLGSTFTADTVQVVTGDGQVAADLLQERFDHIFFTGGGRVARLVMAAAARHLTPVTLELGGRSPAIVLADADPQVTARRLIWGKGLNAGQTCIAPDHVLVVPSIRPALLSAMAQELARAYGPVPLQSPDLAQIVNDRQFQRLEGLLQGARARGQVLLGGGSDAAVRRMEPTVIAVTDSDDPLLQEELFGPLLPLLEIRDLDQALVALQAQPKPLALYLFGGTTQQQQQLLAGSSSGAVVFNDVILQGSMATLPFGGVGESGMGRYHGESGFLTFSHQRTVLRRSFALDFPLRYPPYRGKEGLVRLLG